MADTVKDTVRSRRVSILVADGVDAARCAASARRCSRRARCPCWSAPRLGPLVDSNGQRALGRAEPADRLLRALRRGLRAGRQRRGRARRRARRARLGLRGLSPLQADRGDRRGSRAPAPLPGRTRRRSREAPRRVARARSTGMLRDGRAGVRGVRRRLRGGDRAPPLLGAQREGTASARRGTGDAWAAARSPPGGATSRVARVPSPEGGTRLASHIKTSRLVAGRRKEIRCQDRLRLFAGIVIGLALGLAACGDARNAERRPGGLPDVAARGDADDTGVNTRDQGDDPRRRSTSRTASAISRSRVRSGSRSSDADLLDRRREREGDHRARRRNATRPGRER